MANKPNRKGRDEMFMRVALGEARRGLGLTTPNPAVGAVLVVRDRIVARGHHQRARGSHAEVECLRNFGKRVPKDATLYVTLEPCCTVGRTGACTSVIINAGVTNVVVGALDPNPNHAGRGIAFLKRAIPNVRAGVLAEDCFELNEGYNKWIQTRYPFVIAKCGMSLDGRLTARASEGRWLTSSASRRHAHDLRARVDAILVGAETIRADDSRLTLRGIEGGRQPWRIVLSRSGSLPPGAHIFTDRFAARTRVFRKIKLDVLLRKLGEENITSVLMEGGGEILSQALHRHLIDKIQLYIAPLLTGGPKVAFAGSGVSSTQHAPRLDRISYKQIGDDICVIGYPVYGRAVAG